MTRKTTPIAFDYTLDGIALTRVSEEKDLGVIITTVSVKMVGTLWGLLVPSMLVYKIW